MSPRTAEEAAREIGLRALVLQGDEVADELALVDPVAELQREGHRGIGLDRADAVDAGDRGDDDDVVALQHRARRGVAHAVDLLVDVGFLLDIGVGARDVGLGLVIVVVGDEILDRVVGEEAPELAVELRGEGLVGREDQRRALRRLDHLGHGEGFAGAGDAEQHLVALMSPNALDQFLDRLRLIALRLEFGHDAEPPPAFGFVRPRRPMRRPRRALADIGIATVEQFLQQFCARRRAGEAARMAFGRRALEFRLRRFAATLRLRLHQGGIEQRREMLVERLQVGPRRFRVRRAGRLSGGGHGGNMGDSGGGGREGELLRPLRRRDELRHQPPVAELTGGRTRSTLCGSRGRREPDAGLPRSRPSESALPPAPTAWRFERGRRVTGLSFSRPYVATYRWAPIPRTLEFPPRDHSLIYSNRF